MPSRGAKLLATLNNPVNTGQQTADQKKQNQDAHKAKFAEFVGEPNLNEESDLVPNRGVNKLAQELLAVKEEPKKSAKKTAGGSRKKVKSKKAKSKKTKGKKSFRRKRLY